MSYENDIILDGVFADIVWSRIGGCMWLIDDAKELHDPEFEGLEYSPETRARVMSFLQIAFFGYDDKHGKGYSEKLRRNQDLVDINPEIIKLAMEDEERLLILEHPNFGRKEISIGFASGGTVMYPLNELGYHLYSRNLLPPHKFEESHLVRDFTSSRACFIGAALHLPGVPLLLAGQKRFPEAPSKSPHDLIQQIGYHALRFVPDVELVESSAGHTLRPIDSEHLPCIITAFSGEGSGESFATNVGFERDKEHPVDRLSGDRRYILDLNDLNRSETISARQKRLLRAWDNFIGLSLEDKHVDLRSKIEGLLASM